MKNVLNRDDCQVVKWALECYRDEFLRAAKCAELVGDGKTQAKDERIAHDRIARLIMVFDGAQSIEIAK